MTFNITLSGYNTTTFDENAQSQLLKLVFEELSNDLPDSIESLADIHIVYISQINKVNGGVLVTTTVKARATALPSVIFEMTLNSSHTLPYDPYGSVTVTLGTTSNGKMMIMVISPAECWHATQ